MPPREPEKPSLTEQAIALRQELLQGQLPQNVVDVMLIDWWRAAVTKS